MFKQLIQLSRRIFVIQKGYTLVNITGLAVGIAVCLMTFRVVEFNLSYDSFQPNAGHIYRFVTQVIRGDNTHLTEALPGPFPAAFKNDFPDLKKMSALFNLEDAEVQVMDAAAGAGRNTPGDPHIFQEPQGVFFTQPELFDILYSKWLAGDPSVLTEPNMVILDKDHAIKYFDRWQEATGRYLKLDNDLTLKVAGVIDNYPVNSDFPLQVIVSWPTLIQHPNYYAAGMNNWGGRLTDYQAFISLQENVTAASVNRQLVHFVDKYYPTNGHAKWSAWLQPLADMHFDDRFTIFPGHPADKNTLWTLGVIGAFILLMALINFINLATAQAISRSKEIGILKILGCGRGQLVARFLGETALVVLVAVIVASVISLPAWPLLHRSLDIPVTAPLFTGSTFIFLVLCECIVTLLAGLYPALVLSGFDPLAALKNKINTSAVGGVSIRRGLVVVQFASLQILIIGTIVVLMQMNFVRHADMGFNKDAIIEIPLREDRTDTNRNYELNMIKSELARLPGVMSTAFCSAAPASEGNFERGFMFNNATEYADFTASYKSADPDYFNTFQLRFAAGKGYEDGNLDKGMVINETMVKKLHLPDPASAIGKIIRFGPQAPPVPIVGVVKDFKDHSLRDTIDPMMIFHLNRLYGQLDIKVGTADLVKTLPAIRDLWRATWPQHVFDYTFLDDNIARFYRQETQMASLYKLLTVIAVVISCLGLFALVSYMSIRRIREMSIRKVLGASVSHIVYLFSREFTVLIIVAFAVAGPCAWWFVHHWLARFTYRVNVSGSIFLLSVAGSVMIAWLTIGWHAVRLALVNPARSLKGE